MSLSAAVSYSLPGRFPPEPLAIIQRNPSPESPRSAIGPPAARTLFRSHPIFPRAARTKLLFELSQCSESDSARVHVAVRSAMLPCAWDRRCEKRKRRLPSTIHRIEGKAGNSQIEKASIGAMQARFSLVIIGDATEIFDHPRARGENTNFAPPLHRLADHPHARGENPAFN